MPIDINVILAPFVTPFRQQWRTITDAMESLGKLVSERYQRATALEIRTRAYPVIGFVNGAVMLALPRSQAGLLGPPPPDFTMVDQIRQELIIPNTVGVLARMTGELRASAERFQTPTSEMFRLDRPGRFVDIFGHGVLLARSIFRDFDPLAAAALSSARSVAAAREQIPELRSSPSEPAASTESSSGSGLDDVLRYIGAGILLVPAFTQWMDIFVREIGLAVRIRLINAFQGIEQTVLSLRRDILTDVLDMLRDTGQSAVEFLLVAQTLLTSNIRYFGAFATVYSGMLIFTLSRFSAVLQSQVNSVIDVANLIMDVINKIMSFDLVPILLGPLIGPLASYVSLPLPTFTIDDLVTTLTDIAGTGASGAALLLQGQLALYSEAADFLGLDWLASKLGALSDLIGGARRHIEFPNQPPITPLTTVFPDIWALLITPFRARWAGLLTTLRDATGNVIEQTLFQAATLTEGLAVVFDRVAGGASWLGGPDLWRRLATTSDQLAFEAFGVQAAERRGRLGSHPDLALANTFDRAVARGGFDVVTAAIPAYIGGLILFWRERRREFEARRESRVSPHILARRGRLVRVRVPRVVLRARVEGGLDAPGQRSRLIETLALRMKESVEEAWRTGELAPEPSAG